MGFSKVLGLVALLSFVQLSCQVSLPTDPIYKAAVVEFAPALTGTSRGQLKENLKNMLSIIESNITQNLDILVFPEYVLNNKQTQTFVPDPAAGIIPCETADYDFFLISLSCAARSRKVYIVVNLLEKVNCERKDPRCSDTSTYMHNTNVVFDRNGRVISRYRKTNLYGYEWYSTQVLPKPELATFKTDFGVTFGHFICFDMLFYAPAMRLIRELNITDIIYPTYWYSELPFLTAIQLQEGWAYGNDINLLAAGASNPDTKNTGSGIYAGKFGRIVANIFQERTTKVMLADVPKRNYLSTYELPVVIQPLSQPSLETDRFTKLSLLRDSNVDIFSTKLLAQNFILAEELVCHGDFCCNFHIKRTLIAQSSRHASYRYRLAAYFGDRTTFQGKDPSAMAVCAVIACTSEELYSCGHIFPEDILVGNTYYFDKLLVNGTFPHAKRHLIMPSTVDGAMMPLPLSMYNMQQEIGVNATRVGLTLTSPKADLLTFGIWGNYYSERPKNHNLSPLYSKNSAHNMKSSIFFIAMLFIFSIYY